MKGNDTAELFFENVKIPQTNLLGSEEGKGFYQLMKQLPWERLYIGIAGLGAADCALEETLKYVKERKAFGKRVFDFQNTKFTLAKLKSEQNTERFAVKEKIDAKIIKKIAKDNSYELSVKDLEIQEEKAALKEYGSSSSGASIGDILGAALEDKKKTTKNKDGK